MKEKCQTVKPLGKGKNKLSWHPADLLHRITFAAIQYCIFLQYKLWGFFKNNHKNGKMAP